MSSSTTVTKQKPSQLERFKLGFEANKPIHIERQTVRQRRI